MTALSRHGALLLCLVVGALMTGACATSIDGSALPASSTARGVPLEGRLWPDWERAAARPTVPDEAAFQRVALRAESWMEGTYWAPVQADVAKPAGSGGGDLSAAAQNPIASNISLPLENNFQFGSGPDNETSWVLNVQPVIPVRVGKINVINRPIVPLMFVPGAVVGLPENGGDPVGLGDTFGLGDINVTSFLSPADSKKIIWGVGPSLTIPSATDDLLGSGKWSAGPSLVALTIQKPWLAGVLVRHLWSFAGDANRGDVNQTILQPFVNYNLDGGWYLVTAPVLTADWSAPTADRFVVPVGMGLGRIFKVGKQPVNTNLHLYYNAVRPEDGPDWSIRFAVQLIFPSK